MISRHPLWKWLKSYDEGSANLKCKVKYPERSGHVPYLPISERNIPPSLAFDLEHQCKKEEEADKDQRKVHGGCIAII